MEIDKDLSALFISVYTPPLNHRRVSFLISTQLFIYLGHRIKRGEMGVSECVCVCVCVCVCIEVKKHVVILVACVSYSCKGL